MPSLRDVYAFTRAWGAPYYVLGAGGTFIHRPCQDYTGTGSCDYGPSEPSYHFPLVSSWQGDAWGGEIVGGARAPAGYAVMAFYTIPDPPEMGFSAG